MEEINNPKQFYTILGDFNINFIGKKPRMFELFLIYHHIFTKPTHVSGSLIDRGYLEKRLFASLNIESTVITVNFTDYDAVRFCLSGRFN